jgi:hypothetical protein
MLVLLPPESYAAAGYVPFRPTAWPARQVMWLADLIAAVVVVDRVPSSCR